MTSRQFLITFLSLTTVIGMSACGEKTSIPNNEQAIIDAEVDVPINPTEEILQSISPCQVDSTMVGGPLKVAGQIEFIDRGDPQGLFIGLTDQGCMLGIFVENTAFEQWEVNQQAAITEGNSMEFIGTLTSFGGELVLEVYAKQESEEGQLDSGTLDEKEHMSSVKIRISDDPGSRWQDMTISIFDEAGQPLEGVSISIKQKDLDFFHSISSGAWTAWIDEEGIGWREDAEEQIEIYNDLGTNNWEFMPWWGWHRFEPVDDQWDFFSYTDLWNFTDRFYWESFFPNVRFNTFWLGPQFDTDRLYQAPDWLNFRNDEEFRAEFTEYITEAFNLNPSKHFDLYEIGIEINDWPTWEKGAWEINEAEWDWAIDFLKFESDLVRSLDPNAKISIDFDIVRLFDCDACYVENWIERVIAADVDFDVIGLELHPQSVAGEPATIEEFDAFLKTLKKFGKDFYIWEFGIRSHGDPIQELVLGELQYPNIEEYTEENQRDLFLEFIKYFIEDPDFLGIRYITYRDGLFGDRRGDNKDALIFYDTAGLLREDRTPKPAYYAIKEYWESLLTDVESKSNAEGSFIFSAIPGMFEIIIGPHSEVFHLEPGLEYSLAP